MERKQALARVRRILGAKAYWKIRDGITSPEKRAAHTDLCRQTTASKDEAAALLKARREVVLAADVEYQRLLAAWKIASKAQDDARFHDKDAGYKFEVGTQQNLGIFNSLTPRAYGDTWEEIFDKLEAQKQVRAAS